MQQTFLYFITHLSNPHAINVTFALSPFPEATTSPLPCPKDRHATARET